MKSLWIAFFCHNMKKKDSYRRLYSEKMESPSSSWYLHLIEEALVHKLLFIFLLRMLSFAPETSWPITWKSTFNISWHRSSLNIFSSLLFAKFLNPDRLPTFSVCITHVCLYLELLCTMLRCYSIVMGVAVHVTYKATANCLKTSAEFY